MSHYFANLSTFDLAWLIIGFLGQFMFSARFILQWLASEKHRKSTIPISFWYCSILGSVTLLAYAIHKRDPVFILGQSFGVFIYLRNLYFIYENKKSEISDD